MKQIYTPIAVSLLTLAMAACSSSSDPAPVNDDDTPGTPVGPITPTPPTTPTTPNPPETPVTPVTPPDYGDLPDPVIPEVDLTAAPVPGPTAPDFFGSFLEIDDEEAVAGGPPTTPKNLRIDLVSNDWAEFSWAPSNDDGEVVAYRIEPRQKLKNSGAQHRLSIATTRVLQIDYMNAIPMDQSPVTFSATR